VGTIVHRHLARRATSLRTPRDAVDHEALPGVKAASTVQFLPLAGTSCGTGFWLEGQPPDDASHALPTDCSLVSRGYFDAMGIPILDGRPFDRPDRMGSPRVLIVNRSSRATFVTTD